MTMFSLFRSAMGEIPGFLFFYFQAHDTSLPIKKIITANGEIIKIFEDIHRQNSVFEITKKRQRRCGKPAYAQSSTRTPMTCDRPGSARVTP
jgi:hypothetical protein